MIQSPVSRNPGNKPRRIRVLPGTRPPTDHPYAPGIPPPCYLSFCCVSPSRVRALPSRQTIQNRCHSTTMIYMHSAPLTAWQGPFPMLELASGDSRLGLGNGQLGAPVVGTKEQRTFDNLRRRGISDKPCPRHGRLCVCRMAATTPIHKTAHAGDRSVLSKYASHRNRADNLCRRRWVLHSSRQPKPFVHGRPLRSRAKTCGRIPRALLYLGLNMTSILPPRI
jgi:hypothetical protein